MKVLKGNATLGQVEVRTGADLALVAKAITMTCVLNRIRPVCLRTSVVGVTHLRQHGRVCL